MNKKPDREKKRKAGEEDEEKEPEPGPETEPEPGLGELKKPIDERIDELKEEGKTPSEIVLILYEEEYSTHEIMKRGLPLRALKHPSEKTAEPSVSLIEGTVKGTGALQEFKELIRVQISKTRDLSEAFYNLGLGVLLASLSKAGISIEDFRKIATQEGPLKDALKTAGDTAFKALEYYHSDLITHVETERDEARAYASLLETRVEEIKKIMDPKVRMEKMIYNLVLLSGTVKMDPEALEKVLSSYIGLEVIAQ